MREGLMSDVGYHGSDRECPEEPTEEKCSWCSWWNKEKYCEQLERVVYEEHK